RLVGCMDDCEVRAWTRRSVAVALRPSKAAERDVQRNSRIRRPGTQRARALHRQPRRRSGAYPRVLSPRDGASGWQLHGVQLTHEGQQRLRPAAVTFDQLMEAALVEASRAREAGEVPIGAVV